MVVQWHMCFPYRVMHVTCHSNTRRDNYLTAKMYIRFRAMYDH